MQKRQYLKRSRSRQQFKNDQICIICALKSMKNITNSNPFPLILITKYTHISKMNREVNTINRILHPKHSNPIYINFRQAQQRTKSLQMLAGYRKFQSTVQMIKPLILQRTKKDNITPLHFRGHPFRLMMRRFLNKKILLAQKQKTLKKVGEKNKGSGISTDEQIYASPVKYKNLVKLPDILQKEGQTPEIRRLTRNISNMVKKFDDNFEFHPSIIFDILDSAPAHILDEGQLQKVQLFKKQLINNISIIHEKKHVEKLHTQNVEMGKYCDNYGIHKRGNTALSRNLVKTSRECFKKQSTNKSKSKCLKENVSPNQRVHTDYDCEVIKKEKKKLSGYKIFSKAMSPPLKSLSNKKGTLKFGSTQKLIKRK